MKLFPLLTLKKSLRILPLNKLDSLKATLVTVLNDRFAEYFGVLLRSVLLHNPWFHFPITIFYSKTISPLQETSQHLMSRIYSNIRYVEVDEQRYKHFHTQTPSHLLPALFSLECFNLTHYMHIVFLDSDMLCLGDISELFTTLVDFGACPGGRNLSLKEGVAGSFRRRVAVNSGMMVIGSRYLNERTYRALFRCQSGPFADQSIFNQFFRFRRVYFFHHKYNYHAQFFWNNTERDKEVRLLHYAGTKPLDQPELDHMHIWFEYQKRFKAS
jgi:lipopolysaccharide biosynthesis glycosyltransferase